MTNTTLDISVIICAYTEDRWDDLVAAVESVMHQSTSVREVIVVVDHNKRLLEQVRMHLPDVFVVENQEAQGLSGARNSGIAIAKGQKIAFLDDDAVAESDWLMRLSQCFDDPQVLGAGGKVAPMWISRQPAWFPEEFYWVVGCAYLGLPQTLAPVRNPFGGCMCVRREVFELAGGFRSEVGRVTSIPFGCEETELCIRACQLYPRGMFIYEPRAVIHHRIPPSRAQWGYFYKRCYAEGRSKALVSRLVGAKDGLASERTYTFRTLPRGVLQGVQDAFFRQDPFGLVRAGAIIAGLAITTAGYLAQTISRRKLSNVGKEREIEV